MLRTVLLSDPAKADLAAARQWLSQPGAGERASSRKRQIADAIIDLRRHPCRWPSVEHDGYRERPVGGYMIVYQVDPDTGRDTTAGDVFVLAIFAPGQDRSRL